jgi:hypothetical protein
MPIGTCPHRLQWASPVWGFLSATYTIRRSVLFRIADAHSPPLRHTEETARKGGGVALLFFCLTCAWQRGFFLPVVQAPVCGFPGGVSRPERRRLSPDSDRCSLLKDHSPASGF